MITTIIKNIFNFFFFKSGRIRALLYGLFFSIGNRTIILGGFSVRNPQELRIGNDCFINFDCFIQASGGVSIGNDVELGPRVSILSENHFFDKRNKKIREQGYKREHVIIEDNVWIGVNAVILPGVTIRSGSVVGAGAVVTKSFEENSIIVGVPAKLLKKR